MSVVPAQSAPVIADAAEALRIADDVARQVQEGSARRDLERLAPTDELALIARSGLLGIAVPARFGGPQLPPSVHTEVFRRLARADSSVAQLLLAHFVLQWALDALPDDHPVPARLFGDVLAGAQLGNATAERGTKHGWEHRTRAERDAAGGWRITGTKHYATGSLGATWIAVRALRGPEHPLTGYVRPDADGLELHLDEWSSFGQRCTFSGRVELNGVHVPDELVDDRGPRPQPDGPTVHGAYDQVLHAAIDVGIARAALEDGAAFVRTRTRPWREAAEPRAADEPHVLRRFGELQVRLDALEALLERAGARLDDAVAAPAITDEASAAASLAVASVKALSQELATDIASGVLELAGTAATDEAHGLDRHWRNVRVHSLHDPARWKYVHIGNALLNGVLPPPNDLF